MAGSARSDVRVTMMSVRVAGNPDYIPAHMAAGRDKPTSQRALFRVFHNDGGDKANVFSCTAWGKLADACARGCAPGKEVHIIGELKSYDAKVWEETANGQREPKRGLDGSFAMTKKVGIKVDRIIFGSDSAGLIIDEIGKGLRPPLFSVNGSPDEAAWINVCKQRNAEQFAPGNPKFGYADVKVPANAQLVAPNQTGTGQAQLPNYAPPAYAPPAYAPPVAPPASAPAPAYAPPAYGAAPGAPAYGAPPQGAFQPPAAPAYAPPVAPPAATPPPAYTPPAYTPPAPTGYQPPTAPAYAPPTAPPTGYQPPTAPAYAPPAAAATQGNVPY